MPAMKIPDKCCLNCHFLVAYVGQRPDDDAEWAPVYPTFLRYIIEDMESPIDMPRIGRERFCCHWRVFVGKELNGQEELHSELLADRGETCFFFPRHDGMSLGAAGTLERREADRREAERDRSLTRRAFKVAFAALIISILVAVANLVWDLWKYHHSR